MKEYIPLLGSGAFGVLVGWFVYYINRYRKGDVQFSDLTTLVGIIGGGSILALFEQGAGASVTKQQMFGAYGIGLFIGFFGYFLSLIILVKNSEGAFKWTWFLDGRRRNPDRDHGEDYPGSVSPPANVPMSDRMTLMEERMNRLPAAGNNALGPNASVLAYTPIVMDTVNPSAAKVIAKCEEKWDANQSDCNAFVKAVSEALGVAGLSGNADQIVDVITSEPGWRQLQNGAEAKNAADAGELVIGGLKGSEHTPARTHGHVVIVVTGGLAHKKYPTGYWGSLGGIGKKNATINYSWQQADRDKVHYAAKTIA